MDKKFIIEVPEDFDRVVEEVLLYFKNTPLSTAGVIALKGDLGAGKTAFTQRLGKMLGVSEVITSPTFTIMKLYEVQNDLFERLVHIDAYRIEDESELGPLRVSDYINDPSNIICIEWSELVLSIIPANAISLDINITERETREVHIYTK